MATLEAIMVFDKLDSSRFGPGLGENLEKTIIASNVAIPPLWFAR